MIFTILEICVLDSLAGGRYGLVGWNLHPQGGWEKDVDISRSRGVVFCHVFRSFLHLLDIIMYLFKNMTIRYRHCSV